MISMHDVNSIRTLRRRGESIASISRIVGHSEPTVRKYLKAQDLSPVDGKLFLPRGDGTKNPYQITWGWYRFSVLGI